MKRCVFEVDSRFICALTLSFTWTQGSFTRCNLVLIAHRSDTVLMRSGSVLLVLNIFVLSFSLASVRILISPVSPFEYVLALFAQMYSSEGASYLVDFREP